MKTLSIFLLFTLSAFSQQFGDDNQSGDWLPIPDGYVWPEPAEKAPDFNPTWKNLSELDKNQQNAIKENWPDENLPERVEMALIDLNADGKPEIFVDTPTYSGTGGTYYQILSTKDGKSYRNVGGILGWGIQFLVRKNDWLQIEGMSRGGGGNYTRYLMTFVTDGYEISRNEGHDYNNQKVTIRTRDAERDGSEQAADGSKSE